MPDKKSSSMEAAGSLVPQLEGAPHSSGHDRHPSPAPASQPHSKGGIGHS